MSLESGATGSSSDVDLERLYQVRMEERANAEMERLRLEKQINDLQRINDDLEDQLDELQQGQISSASLNLRKINSNGPPSKTSKKSKKPV